MTLLEKEQERAKRLVADLGFQYAFRMHALLQLFYANNKGERQRQYKQAGIRKSLKAAERRVASAIRSGKGK